MSNEFSMFALDVTDVPTIWTRIALAMLHSLWIGAAIGVAALAIYLVLRRGHWTRVNYTVLVIALFATAASPVMAYHALAPPTMVTTFEPAAKLPDVELAGEPVFLKVEAMPTAEELATSETEPPVMRLRDEANMAYVPVHSAPEYSESNVMTVVRAEDSVAWGKVDAATLPKAIVLLYAAVASLLLARLAVGIAGGSRLRQRSELIGDGAILSAMVRHTRSLGMKITPAIAYCNRVAVPTVVGIVRPMILLPIAAATGMNPEQVEYLILHELAHIRRYDHLVNLLQRIIEAVMFYHPVVWLLSRQIRIEREHCCDDLVVRLGGDAQHYAESLLAAASLANGMHLRGAVPAIGATGKASHLRHRVARILGEPAPAVRLRHGSWMFVALLAFASVFALAQLQREQPSPPPVAVAVPATPAAPVSAIEAPAETPIVQPPRVSTPQSAPPEVEAPVESSESRTNPESAPRTSALAAEPTPNDPPRADSSAEQTPSTAVSVSELQMQLTDKDWWLRKLAVKQLAETKQKGIWMSLVPALHDEDVRVKAAAATALGELQVPGSIKHLVAALKESGEPADAAAKALAKFEPALVMPLIRLAAEDEDASVRRGAVRALREVKSPETTEITVTLLGKVPMYGEDPRGRRQARPSSDSTLVNSLQRDSLAEELSETLALLELDTRNAVLEQAKVHLDWHVRAGLMKVVATPMFGVPPRGQGVLTGEERAAFLNQDVIALQTAAMHDAQREVRVWAAAGLGLALAASPTERALNEARTAGLVTGLRDANLHIAMLCGDLLSDSRRGVRWQPTNQDDAIAFHIAGRRTNDLVSIGKPAIPALVTATKAETAFPIGDGGPMFDTSFIADALASIGGPEALEPLLAMLNSVDTNLTYKICEALGDIGDQRAVEPLMRLAGDSNEYTRYSAIVALGKLKDPRGFDAIVAGLKSSSKSDRRAAATAAGLLGDQRTTPLLIALLETEKDGDFLGSIIESLGNLRDPASVPAVATLLNEKSDARAAVALAQIGDATARDALVSGLRTSEEAKVRSACAKALGALKDSTAIAPLTETLGFDREVFKAAADALAAIGTPEAIQALHTVFVEHGRRADNVKLAEAILDALIDTPSTETSDVLYALLRESMLNDPELGVAAASALAIRKDTRAVEFLEKLRESSSVRVEAERALAQLSGGTANPTAPAEPDEADPNAEPAAANSTNGFKMQFRLVVPDAEADGKVRIKAPIQTDPGRTIAISDDVWVTEADLVSIEFDLDANYLPHDDLRKGRMKIRLSDEADQRLRNLYEEYDGRELAIIVNDVLLVSINFTGKLSGTLHIDSYFSPQQIDAAQKAVASLRDDNQLLDDKQRSPTAQEVTTSAITPQLQVRLVLGDDEAEGKGRVPAPTEAEPERSMALAEEVWITEADVDSVEVKRDESSLSIYLSLTDEAAERMRQKSSENVGRQLAVVYDGTIISAPVLRSEIGKSIAITGDFTADMASAIAQAISPKVGVAAATENDSDAGL